MIIGLEAVDAAPAGIVEMDADEDGIVLRVFDRDTLLEWNEDVAGSRHHGFQIRFPEFAGKPFRHIKGRNFFRAAKFSVSAVVLAAVTGIDHHRLEGLARKPPVSATPAPVVSMPTKPGVDQTAQTITYCNRRLVDKVSYRGTEITPAVFEAQMKELQGRGITVIGMQDLLAWKRGEKNI